MSDSKKLKIGSLVGGIAFGGFSFCGLNDVDADVVQWADPGSEAVGVGSSIFFDINGDGQNDLVAINSSNIQGLSVGRFPGDADVRTNGPVVAGAGGPQVAGFNTGVGTYVISGANTNLNSYGYFANGDGDVGPDFQGDSPVTRNFAFSFSDSDSVELFAWGTVQYNGPGEAFTIISGAYEDEGNSLLVGEVGAVVETPDTPAVPEPSSLMLLGLGAAGLAGFRRKRSA